MVKYKIARKVAVVSLDCLFLNVEDKLLWNEGLIARIRQGNYDRLILLGQSDVELLNNNAWRVKEKFKDDFQDEKLNFRSNTPSSDKRFFQRIPKVERWTINENAILVLDFYDVSESNLKNQIEAVNINYEKERTIINPIVVNSTKNLRDYQQEPLSLNQSNNLKMIRLNTETNDSFEKKPSNDYEVLFYQLTNDIKKESLQYQEKSGKRVRFEPRDPERDNSINRLIEKAAKLAAADDLFPQQKFESLRLELSVERQTTSDSHRKKWTYQLTNNLSQVTSFFKSSLKVRPTESHLFCDVYDPLLRKYSSDEVYRQLTQQDNNKADQNHKGGIFQGIIANSVAAIFAAWMVFDFFAV